MRGPRELPTTGTVLGVLSMIAYPVTVGGLAWAVGSTWHEVAGWSVALIGVLIAAAPKYRRDLDARNDARDQQTWQGKGDPVQVAAPIPRPAPTPPEYGPPAGPSVSRAGEYPPV